MKKINDGGPAFPQRVENNNDEPFVVHGVKLEPGYFVQFRGMALRDYFAAKAMQGILANPESRYQRNLGEWAYKAADAMLAERESQQ